jgi:hypothetical protein
MPKEAHDAATVKAKVSGVECSNSVINSLTLLKATHGFVVTCVTRTGDMGAEISLSLWSLLLLLLVFSVSVSVASVLLLVLMSEFEEKDCPSRSSSRWN